MRDLQMYKELCKIDMLNNGIYPKYPYNLQDDIVFTQHEIVLNYKQNYCKSIVILTESEGPSGGVESDPAPMECSYVVYDDSE